MNWVTISFILAAFVIGFLVGKAKRKIVYMQADQRLAAGLPYMNALMGIGSLPAGDEVGSDLAPKQEPANSR